MDRTRRRKNIVGTVKENVIILNFRARGEGRSLKRSDSCRGRQYWSLPYYDKCTMMQRYVIVTREPHSMVEREPYSSESSVVQAPVSPCVSHR
eukprot:scaffold1184_cov132-Cylindrotheca_fusiformis.AAC.95